MTSAEIRASFLDFFASKGHRIVPSAPVVPHDDPTLLFTNAGMNQFKDVFLGKGTRDYTRAADTQKCIRVSGKHNDLEEVGRDTYHHTFFEMLGNWSFGDYDKREAIAWAWELLTDVWGLPKERLHATVFTGDDESFGLWTEVTDIDPTHVHRFGEKDNFWEMGDTGPCGPCSEIHIDLTRDGSGASLVNAGSPFVMEIWNLVFIQYDRREDGTLVDLPARHVDTGMGFERICAVLQGKSSNYDTDLFTPLIARIEEVTGRPYRGEDEQVAMRVIADHVRMLTFAIADGAVPGNEGRGYVLRRILRRAARFGRKLGMTEPFIWRIVEAVCATMGAVFPEIVARRNLVERIVRAEEESFDATLGRGLEIFEDIVRRMKRSNTIVMSGEDAFKLYDTFGFPIDLTALMAGERGLTVDVKRFEDLLFEQKERSRSVTRSRIAIAGGAGAEEIDLDIRPQDISRFQFVGYDRMETDAEVIGLRRTGERTYLVLDQTPFYVESGGQVDDTGTISARSTDLPVVGLLKNDRNIVHVLGGDLPVELGETVHASVDAERRRAIMRNHTATHILHAALRSVLGEHVRQAGSLVEPSRLRFDFSHYAKPSPEELAEIEDLVNGVILDARRVVHHRNIPFEEAKKMGALMFFGEKYGDRVNVIEVPGWSMEFCGGTHVHNTAEIGLFKILSEGSIAGGTRRIEGVTGEGVRRYLADLHKRLEEQKNESDDLRERIRRLEKEIARYRLERTAARLDELLAQGIVRDGVRIVSGRVDAADMEELKSLGDSLRGKIISGVGVLGTVIDGKVALVCVVTDDCIRERGLSAGAIVGSLARKLGGGGGGRPHLATAGGKDAARLDEVLASAPDDIIAGIRK
ncbi:MAG: alanine--tRNA ligase [Bacteroidota bacterium]|nr:alanine--tRNA ligase [Bacteroidota bacterium]